MSMRYGVSLREQYLTYLLGLGQERSFKDRQTNETFQGLIQGIYPQGRLIVYNQSGIKYYWMKEIEFLFSNPAR